MAQNNTFRTKRRRLNSKRNATNAIRRSYCDKLGLKRSAHQSLKSALKRDEVR